MNAVQLVKHFEGFHRVVKSAPPILATPYLCPANYWTIGYGHLCKQDHPPISEAQGEVYLEEDMARAKMAVLSLINRPLTDGQLGALTSWTFNLGIGRLRGSTLRAVINRGEYDRAPAELRRWVYAGGRKLAGLIARREAEVALWLA